MKRSTNSTCLTAPKTQKPRMYVVVVMFTMLFSSSAWSTQQTSAVDVAVAAAGDLDPTIGTNRTVVSALGLSDSGVFLAIQNDGKIVTAGWSVPNRRILW